MSTGAWVVLLVVTVPALFLLVYIWFDNSVVRIPPGKVGLLMIKGRATNKTLLPGPHIVPAFRRREAQEYPSTELSYRAGGAGPDSASELEQAGPAIAVTLGDRTEATVSCTARFLLVTDSLKSVHERFGPSGIWSIVGDQVSRTVRSTLGDPVVGSGDLYGAGRGPLQERIATELTSVLKADGFAVTMFSLGDVDLGRTGDVIQATVRARVELEREQAEHALRLARAQNDAELQPFLAGAATDAALRYRETDVWRELAQRPDPIAIQVPAPRRPSPPAPESEVVAPEAAGEA